MRHDFVSRHLAVSSTRLPVANWDNKVASQVKLHCDAQQSKVSKTGSSRALSLGDESIKLLLLTANSETVLSQNKELHRHVGSKNRRHIKIPGYAVWVSGQTLPGSYGGQVQQERAGTRYVARFYSTRNAIFGRQLRHSSDSTAIDSTRVSGYAQYCRGVFFHFRTPVPS